MNKLMIAAGLLMALTLGTACSDNDPGNVYFVSDRSYAYGEGSFTIDNDSRYDIYEVYISETRDGRWGPDLLGGGVLRPRDSITVDVDCGFYDALIVDEGGYECELVGVEVCEANTVWVIDNRTIDRCY